MLQHGAHSGQGGGHLAGASLLAIAPALTPDRRNEVAVELSKVLETGQTEISQYIPQYLGQFALWLTPRAAGRDRGSDAAPPLLRQHGGGGRRP